MTEFVAFVLDIILSNLTRSNRNFYWFSNKNVFTIVYPPLITLYDGASHILCLVSWSVTWLFIIGGNHHTLQGSVLYDVIRLQYWLQSRVVVVYSMTTSCHRANLFGLHSLLLVEKEEVHSTFSQQFLVRQRIIQINWCCTYFSAMKEIPIWWIELGLLSL